MNGIIICLFLIACFAAGLSFAASRGYTIPVCIVLIIVGALVVVAPTAFSAWLQHAGRVPQITKDESTTCWILGGLMTVVGIIASIFSSRARGNVSK